MDYRKNYERGSLKKTTFDQQWPIGRQGRKTWPLKYFMDMDFQDKNGRFQSECPSAIPQRIALDFDDYFTPRRTEKDMQKATNETRR